jgi:hypothetical protein
MAHYAIVLAGVPASAADQVLQALRADFSAGHVITSDRASRWHDRYAVYDGAAIEKALAVCMEAVFSTSRRPISFCRRPSQACVIGSGVKRNKGCGLTETQVCSLKKPDHLIVLYQESRNDDPLLRALSFSAFARPLSRACYGKANATIDAARSAIQSAKERLKVLSPIIREARRMPYLLPIANYIPGAVIHLLRRTSTERDLPLLAKQFISKYWVEAEGSFLRQDQMAFKPADAREWHGGRGEEESTKKVLKTEYRLGCSYDPGFHYDVSRASRGNLSGVAFMCSRWGRVTCAASDNYVNIYPDDFVRGAHGSRANPPAD